MEQTRILELMDRAIAEARRSRPEDAHLHPKVGAVLAGPDGKELCAGYRNELGAGEHAEYVVLGKAAGRDLNLRACSLFVTLEPCTRRGEEKIPCAVRVALAGLGSVFIGTLDPNPHITGRGESFLATHARVERFPHDRQVELRKLNEEFFAEHRHAHIPTVSLLTDPDAPSRLHFLLRGQREGILQQTMDLLTGSQGPVWIMSGRLSWLRELHFALVFAATKNRAIRILCSVPAEDPQGFHELKDIAAASGAEIGIARRQFSTRATLVGPYSAGAAMIAVESAPTLHASILKSPHERGLLEATARFFEYEFDLSEEILRARRPEWRHLADGEVIRALRRGVPCYAEARIAFERIPLAEIRPLSGFLERFKLARLHLLAALGEDVKPSRCTILAHSPWPIVPPIVERQPDGTAVVVDGTHRVYSALERGEADIEAIVVERATAPLPGTPPPNWEGVVVLPAKTPRHERYQNFDQRLFRPIRDAFSSLKQITH